MYVSVVSVCTTNLADVNAKDKYGWTALHQAAQEGKVKAIAALIKAGADVNAKNNGVFFGCFGRYTALDIAIRKGKTDVIAYFSKQTTETKNNIKKQQWIPFYDLVSSINPSNRKGFFKSNSCFER